MKLPKLGLLPKIIVAILLGILCGLFFPDALTRVFLTFNSLFGNFLSFIIPLLIIAVGDFFYGKVMHKRFQAKQAAFSVLTDQVQESVSGIRVIKALPTWVVVQVDC